MLILLGVPPLGNVVVTWCVCREVRHRAVLKVVERDVDDATVTDSSPRCVDVMSQSVPTDFIFSSSPSAAAVYSSLSHLQSEVRH